jgi:phosphoenolpyruvate---glycerone phosphotransferase subunit DhaK
MSTAVRLRRFEVAARLRGPAIMQMEKFINNPQNLVGELLEGFALGFPDRICFKTNTVSWIVQKSPEKVRLIILGDSGHEAGLSGFVGEGMLDYSVAREIFAALGTARCIVTIRNACAGGSTALLIVLNRAGDVLSAKYSNVVGPARRPENQNGFDSRRLCWWTECGGLPRTGRSFAVYKIVGRAAEQGAPLCLNCAGRRKRDTDFGLAVRTAAHPSTGSSIFELGEDEMEIGLGQHGEAGTGR